MATLEPFLLSVYSRANCLHPEAFFVRLDSRCNQKCGFCNILGPGVEFSMSGQYAKAMMRQVARLRAGATVNFTGGEPTLRGDLPELIRFAKSAGIARVVLQSNAIRFARPEVLSALMEAGLDDALVSFHSHRASVSDALTRAPGTWEKTVAGIEAALGAGLPITLNMVLTSLNAADLPETVEYALRRFPGLHGIILSPLQPHGDLLNHLELLPRYSELVMPVRRAASLIRQGGVNLYLSYCENPLCWLLEVFDAEPSQALRAEISRRLQRNGCGDCHLSTMMDKDKVKPDGCADCYMEGLCYGLWRKYWEVYGAEELRPAPAPVNARPLRHRVSAASHLGQPPPGFVPLAQTAMARRWQGRLRKIGRSAE